MVREPVVFCSVILRDDLRRCKCDQVDRAEPRGEAEPAVRARGFVTSWPVRTISGGGRSTIFWRASSTRSALRSWVDRSTANEAIARDIASFRAGLE
jgi:hypothetical protein